MTVWQTLIQKGLIQSGTIVGIKNPTNTKYNIQLIVNRCEVSQKTMLHVSHLDNNKTGWIDCDTVIEIDGMNIDRYCSQAGIDHNGQSTIKGKKRGRKAKIK